MKTIKNPLIFTALALAALPGFAFHPAGRPHGAQNPAGRPHGPQKPAGPVVGPLQDISGNVPDAQVAQAFQMALQSLQGKAKLYYRTVDTSAEFYFQVGPKVYGIRHTNPTDWSKFVYVGTALPTAAVDFSKLKPATLAE